MFLDMLKVPNLTLQKMESEGGFTAPNGERVDTGNAGGIDWYLCEALYRTVREHRPTKCLEIGMAAGSSTLSILTALAEIGDQGTLVSIDPFQTTGGRNAGRNHVEKSGFSARHTVMEEMDFIALPKLLSEGQAFDFAYIDGNHDFEHVMLDFFYVDRLLKTDGIVGFNDCGWRTVHAALRRIPRRDQYVEVDVGLKPDYAGASWLATVERHLTRRSSVDRYFRKLPAKS
jgi:predicted O-methyltransferase YrrM